MKVHADKKKVMVLNGEEGLECEVCMDRVLLEEMAEFKYLRCVLNESGTDFTECHREMMSRRKVALLSGP